MEKTMRGNFKGAMDLSQHCWWLKYVKCGGSKHPSLTTNQGESMPRKGYKRQAGRSAGMPERMEAQNFNRRISANEALILATAGNGSKTDGFRNLMCLFRELHNLGFKDFEDIRGLISKRQEIN
jgi:hypothetical protein